MPFTPNPPPQLVNVGKLRTALVEFLQPAQDARLVPDVDAAAGADPLDRREREVRALPAAIDLDERRDYAITELVELMEQSQDRNEMLALDALLHATREATDHVAKMIATA
ncbi:hypothetical protein [Kribbella swartbergensis]